MIDAEDLREERPEYDQRRKDAILGTNSVSEAGLKDYLVFFSIYQTLRRRGISLLRFLLSGETDLEKFVASYRRR